VHLTPAFDHLSLRLNGGFCRRLKILVIAAEGSLQQPRLPIACGIGRTGVAALAGLAVIRPASPSYLAGHQTNHPCPVTSTSDNAQGPKGYPHSACLEDNVSGRPVTLEVISHKYPVTSKKYTARIVGQEIFESDKGKEEQKTPSAPHPLVLKLSNQSFNICNHHQLEVGRQ